MKTKSIILLVCSMMSVMHISQARAASKSKSSYKFVGMIDSSPGVGSSQQYDILIKILNRIELKTGIHVEHVLPAKVTPENMFIQNKADIIRVDNDNYIALIKKKKKMVPLMTTSIAGDIKRHICLWTRKDAKPDSVKDIIGKTLGDDSFDVQRYVMLRKYMKDNGIDKPVWDVFSRFLKVSNPINCYMTLASGVGDYVWGSKDAGATLKLVNPTILSKIQHPFCSDTCEYRAVYVANADTVKSEDIKKIIDVFRDFSKNMSRYEEAKPYISMMRLSQAKIVVEPAVDFAAYMRVQEEAKQKGWYLEGEYVLRYMHDVPFGEKIKIPPPPRNIKKCHSSCEKKKNYVSCMKACKL